MSYELKTLGTVAQYINGRAFKPNEWEKEGIPIIRIQNLNNTSAKYNYSSKTYEDKFLIQRGDLLFAWSASLGAHIWKGDSAWLNQHIFKVIPNTDVDRDYLYYYLLKVVAELYQKAHGTGMVHITKKPFMATAIPVPELKIQKQIVQQIEEQLSQLDSAVETLKKTKQQLEVYRQAVLKEAFNRVVDVSQIIPIKDVCKDIKVGIVIKPSQYYTEQNNGIKAFRSANVREFNVNDSDWVYLTKEGNEQNKRSEIHTDDVLIVRSGYPGTACVVPEKYNGCNAIDILIAVPNTDVINSEYLCAYTNSPYGRQSVREKKRGVAQAHLNVGGYSKIKIIVPNLDVQKEVVKSIKEKLSQCSYIENTVNQSLQQAEVLRQSILKKAFEVNKF